MKPITYVDGDARTPARFWERRVAMNHKEAARLEENGWIEDNSYWAYNEKNKHQWKKIT